MEERERLEERELEHGGMGRHFSQFIQIFLLTSRCWELWFSVPAGVLDAGF